MHFACSIRGNGEVIRREEFEQRKAAAEAAHQARLNRKPQKLASHGKNLDGCPLLQVMLPDPAERCLQLHMSCVQQQQQQRCHQVVGCSMMTGSAPVVSATAGNRMVHYYCKLHQVNASSAMIATKVIMASACVQHNPAAHTGVCSTQHCLMPVPHVYNRHCVTVRRLCATAS